MRKVIANTTPIIALAKIDRLNILQKLYGEIAVPEAVDNEIKDAETRQKVDSCDWIKIKKVENNTLKKAYSPRLHDGEVEVIILALSESADLVIMDDNTAKKTAKFAGLAVTGTLGVLIKAKRCGYIDSVKQELDNLQKTGFYVTPELISMVLKEAKE